MRLLLDTQILVWMVNGDPRLRQDWIDAIAEATTLHVSAITAFEYADLQLRGRLPITETMGDLVERFDCEVEALPGDCWRQAQTLPLIHRDPVDRILVAHALEAGMTLATADANIRRYPVSCV